MKMNKQARNFARQVQVDLLALTNADLFHLVHLWVNGAPSGSVSEETRSALGYTLRVREPQALSPSILSGSTVVAEVQWHAPAPQRLRELLAEMDLTLFVQHVLPLAFQSLHAAHPEWGEGATFNAHLANHLRWIGGVKR